MANPADASFSLSTNVPAGTETPNAATGTRNVCDAAGNCATAGPIGGNKVDKKPPTISISSPSNTTDAVNQAVPANYTSSDGGSGMATCAGTIPSGSNVATGAPGSFNFQVNAADNVGNTSSQSVTYSVSYRVCLLHDTTVAKKSGSTYLIKIQLCDTNGANLSSSATIVHAVSVVLASTNAPGTLVASGNANPDMDFRYDARWLHL